MMVPANQKKQITYLKQQKRPLQGAFVLYNVELRFARIARSLELVF
jgi:hypothetical protein